MPAAGVLSCPLWEKAGEARCALNATGGSQSAPS